MAVCCPLLLFFVRIRMTPIHWLGVVFLTYAAVSFLWTPVLVEGLEGWAELLILACAFCLGAEAKNLKLFYIAVALGVTVSAVIALFQINGIEIVEEVAPPSGLFANKNMMGEAATVALIGVVASGAWMFAIGPLVALGLSTCWGAAFGALSALTLWIASKSVLAAVALVLAVVAVGLVSLEKDSTKRDTLIIRGRVWADAIENLKWFGHGVGSYWVATPQHAPRQEAMNIRHWHTHNDALEMVFDFGVGAGVLFVIVALCLMAGEVERYVLAGLIGTGMFGFPLFTAATAFIGAVVAGRAARRWSDLRQFVDDCPDYSGQRDAGSWALHDPVLVFAKRCEAVSAGQVLAGAAGKRSVSV